MGNPSSSSLESAKRLLNRGAALNGATVFDFVGFLKPGIFDVDLVRGGA
jgi:hypothetical protein